jgi:hypothetical protein
MLVMKGTQSLEGQEPRGASRQATPLAAAWRNALTARNTLDLRKAVVEELCRQFNELCGDIVANGNNAERVYQVRMLDASLAQARRQLAFAHSQLEEALGELRRAQSARHGDGSGDQAFAASGNE